VGLRRPSKSILGHEGYEGDIGSKKLLQSAQIKPTDLRNRTITATLQQVHYLTAKDVIIEYQTAQIR
jgi:Fe2+ or Zn2+ uptake regulation protein